jgi:hypothetical protein
MKHEGARPNPLGHADRRDISLAQRLHVTQQGNRELLSGILFVTFGCSQKIDRRGKLPVKLNDNSKVYMMIPETRVTRRLLELMFATQMSSQFQRSAVFLATYMAQVFSRISSL